MHTPPRNCTKPNELINTLRAISSRQCSERTARDPTRFTGPWQTDASAKKPDSGSGGDAIQQQQSI